MASGLLSGANTKIRSRFKINHLKSTISTTEFPRRWDSLIARDLSLFCGQQAGSSSPPLANLPGDNPCGMSASKTISGL